MSNYSYNSSNIKILKGLDPVKKRPGMYIGNIDDGTGLHHMFFEIIDNSIDEYLSGYCNKLIIHIIHNKIITIEDNGRGIPIDIHSEGISAAEIIMTILHAGGKFDNKSYKISGGLHGVGLSVVNALSEYMNLYIYRNHNIYKQIYLNGIPLNPLKVLGTTKKTGTKISFKPSKKVFINTHFNDNIIYKRLQELSFLNNKLKIFLIQKEKKILLFNEGGIKAFIMLLNKKKNTICPIFYFKSKTNNICIEIAIQWNNSYKEILKCYTNNIPQNDGGTHLLGFRTALTKTIKNYIENEKINNKYNINSDDIKEGITAIIAIKMQNPKFSSQTKNKLISSEIKIAVDKELNKKFYHYLLEHPKESKNIINKIINSAKIRDSSRKAREIARKRIALDIAKLPGKLADCQEKNPDRAELYIVEGDSAGGSAKQGRDRRIQAILPLKGKILNVEKSGFDKILLSKEIGTLITALGCGIGHKEFNIKKLRYHTIIIMTDADVDGSHIRTLLLTFFFRYMPKIIEKGYIYIAKPPLFKIKHEKNERYIKNEKELNTHTIKICLKEKTILINEKKINIKKLLFKYILIYNLSKKFKISNLKKLMIVKKIEKNYLNDNFYKHKINVHQLNNKEFVKANHYLVLIKFKKQINKLNNFYNPIILLLKNQLFKKFDKIYDLLEFIINNFLYKNINIQRYKGLGEMNPNQLWDTTMNPLKRRMFKINIQDIVKANLIFNILMGDNVKPRRKFIQTNALIATIDI
ncbi:DNA gyrase subunit B [Candidatus Portiera aleyrodidarum]|uniref:DNA gyrase subunit B n=1 Tax=Candidatus Portiera aleyrodidarum TV TaxID=1297582 RepID=A0A8D4BNB3_9GAMM|nr:DNA gyrase subunit B [Candidatus Portiera aleyrodidarum]AGI27242.1 type IIA topoisomerase (DNA gyrase/topo II, topoisomerase IV), B subunit [Candidatus Portiera aleyrodidarum TV]CEI59234.1 DNA gyrase subunit B [Candidatus Portiera aleyrodidarum]